MRVGLIGWRGMVGSVLINRMIKENDFALIDAFLFADKTSNSLLELPRYPIPIDKIHDAYSLDHLKLMDVIITCHGSQYTMDVHPKLRKAGWQGYWIDAASILRLKEDAIIILDPINRHIIDHALKNGIKDYIGGNCTVSLMLMGLGTLFTHNLVKWLNAITYQAASGAGAQGFYEFLRQMHTINSTISEMLYNEDVNPLEIDTMITEAMQSPSFPVKQFKVPLVGSIIPWIDIIHNSQSREEWKYQVETNKILGRSADPIPIDATCVRVGSIRCHGQAITIKLNQDIPIDEIKDIINSANHWAYVVDEQNALSELTPTAIAGSLKIPVGRLRKLHLGAPGYLGVFTCGDQLLWGAAEPLRRMLRILLERE